MKDAELVIQLVAFDQDVQSIALSFNIDEPFACFVQAQYFFFSVLKHLDAYFHCVKDFT